MNKINFFTELKNRWSSSRPIFFKKLGNYGAWISGIAAGIAALNIVPGMELPPIMGKVAGYVALFGLGVAATSQFPVVNPDYKELDKAKPKDEIDSIKPE